MANTAVLQYASRNRLVYLLTGDGTVVGPTITSAILIADSAPGPLRDILSAAYLNQGAMRIACLNCQPCRVITQLMATGVDVTAESNQITVDVDVDAATPTRPEINITMSDTTGQIAVMTLEYIPPAQR